jgi:DNA-directed RNA polymerase omega subunit
MGRTDKTTDDGDAAHAEPRPEIDSRYRLIVVAALRSKQLQRGASPRIATDPLKRRSTSIALEEVRRGLVPFRLIDVDKENNDGDHHEADDSL